MSFAVGAKAHTLFKMRENGFTIPPFFCVFGEDNEDLNRLANQFFGSGEKVSVRSAQN